MDPNAALNTARKAVQIARTGSDSMDGWADDLLEAFEALDEWLTKGGFPPEEWNGKPDQPNQPARSLYEPIVGVGTVTPSIDGVFGYTVYARTAAGEETELARYVGRVIEWQNLKRAAEDKCREYAKAFGLAYFV